MGNISALLRKNIWIMLMQHVIIALLNKTLIFNKLSKSNNNWMNFNIFQRKPHNFIGITSLLWL